MQQICTATAPAKARIPLAKVKREWHSLRASLESSAKKQRLLAVKCQWDQAKISSLKAHINQLMQDIFRERRASNKIIEEAMSKARKLSADAWEMMNEANLKMTKADELVISERNCASTKIQEERLFQSRESARLRQRLGNTIHKHRREQESTIHLLMAKSNKKYEDIQLKMIVVSTKLKDQCNIWQK